ncbi:MAG TPA: hypothetical protein VFW16_00710 [Streptosporangiaceae bacterium]|nr:hypothetical protein [Streptosporangiaceae bacterium]
MTSADRPGGAGDDLIERLHAGLRAALRSRDMVAAAALRSALAAIANAEAVVTDPPASAPTSSEHVAGAVAGLGAAEAQRRALTDAEVGQIVDAEIAERMAAALVYESTGHAEHARRLRREAKALAHIAGLRR